MFGNHHTLGNTRSSWTKMKVYNLPVKFLGTALPVAVKDMVIHRIKEESASFESFAEFPIFHIEPHCKLTKRTKDLPDNQLYYSSVVFDASEKPPY